MMRKLILALALSLLPHFAFAGAYSLVATSTANDDNTGNDFTANMPSSWSAGNLLLLATAPRGGSAETLTTPSGWTVLKTFTDSGGSIVLLGRIAQEGDTGPTISWSGTSHAWAKMAAWSGDIYTDLNTIVDNSNQASAGSSDLLNVPSLTVGVDDTLVIGISRKNKTTTSNGATVTFAGGFSTLGSGSFTGSRQTYAWGYIQQTTASNISSTDWTVSISESNTRTGITVSLKSASSTPTFTSAPAIGTRTTSSIPINFTSDTTGTVYGARLTDGSSTPTCDQLEAQTATGGVQYWSEAVVATVADTETFGSITDGTVTDGYFCIEDGSGNDSAVASIANMYKLPAFTTALTVASQTDTAYTSNSKVLDGPGTVDWVACPKDASPPSVAQVEARTGGCIVNGATDDATGTMTLTITGTIFPIYDLYYVGSYGGQHEAAVNVLADEALDAPTGKQDVTLASVSPTSWCADFNAAANPDIAAGDIIRIDLVTDPDDFTWNQATDCDGDYTGTSSRQSLEYDVYDTSVGAYMAGGPGTLWFNDPGVSCANTLDVLLDVDSAMDTLDLDTLCDHPLGDALSYAVTTGTLPTGLDPLNGATGEITGTPTVEDESGVAVVITATSTVSGSTATQDIRFFPIDTITVPDCDALDVSACVGLIEGSWLEDSVQFNCSNTVPANQVYGQSPAANTEVEPGTTVSLEVAQACSGASLRTTFLSAETAVPATATYVAGSAYAQDGSRYVALWPESNVVFYRGPFAHRSDGALIINPTGLKAVNPIGVAMTDRGEVIVTSDAPTHVHNGWPMVDDGRVSMTDIF